MPSHLCCYSYVYVTNTVWKRVNDGDDSNEDFTEEEETTIRTKMTIRTKIKVCGFVCTATVSQCYSLHFIYLSL